MALPLTSHSSHHESKPRKVVSTNNHHQNFIIKRNNNQLTHSSSSIPNTSRLTTSINPNHHPIKAKIKLSPAITRPSPSPSPSSSNPISVPHLATRPSALSHHHHNNPTSTITARVVKSSKALHQISSRPNSPFRPIPHTKDIVLSPNITQRPSPSRSRANTHSDRCPSQLDSDCFSSASSTSANADGGSELSRTHPLGLSTRQKPIHRNDHHLSPSKIDINQSTFPSPRTDHHQPVKLPENVLKVFKDELARPTLNQHKLANSLINNLTSSDLSPSLASPLNLIKRDPNPTNETTRPRDISTDRTPVSSSTQRAIPTDPISKTGFNETWTHPIEPEASLSYHTSAQTDQKPSLEEDWEVLNDQEVMGEKEKGEEEEQVTEKSSQVGEVKEDEARVNRKILDLEISNSSLLAINARLERTKLKQTSEIRELRKKLRERMMISAHPMLSYPSEEGGLQSGPEESETEALHTNNNNVESLKIENLMRSDLQFSETVRVLEGLISRAKDALVYQPGEKDLQSKKVLNRVEIGEGEGEVEVEEEENEGMNHDEEEGTGEGVGMD